MPSYVITGASRGLGYQYLKHLSASASNTVIGIVRDVQATEARLAADKITNVHLLRGEMTDPSSLSAAASATADLTSGRGLDVLIHNAASQSDASYAKTATQLAPPEELERELVTAFRNNAVGAAHAINAFLPLIREGREKKVVAISTGMADVDFISRFGMAVGVPYSVSKAAANALVAKFHAAVGRQEGILFLSLSPGLVNTAEGKDREVRERDLEWFRKSFVDNFPDYAPGWKGAISPEESVRMQLDVIAKATVETHGGDFVSHHGNKTWL